MRRFVLLLLLPLLVACGGAPEDEPLQSAQIFVFGTLVDISVWDAEAEQREQALATITRDFQTMHREWHPWNPGPLVELNQALARGEEGEVPASLIPLIGHASELYQLSDGLFNPAIGGLLNLWGFQSSSRPEGPPPSREAIAAWLEQAPSMMDLTLSGKRLRSDNPAVQLDFGAYAKGYAVDVAIQRLRELGIDNAIVNAGGDLRAIGSKSGTPWRIGIQHPQGERERLYAWLDVADNEAIFTSGNYERYREDQGVRYSHILDPRSGMPVVGVTSVTVIHPHDGALADAAATALVVAGVAEWERIAAQMGVDQVMLVDDEGTVHLTRQMAERLEFNLPPQQLNVVELAP